MQGVVKHPKKRFFRARAHSNPLNDQHFPLPACPEEMDWCFSILSFSSAYAFASSQSIILSSTLCRQSHYPSFFGNSRGFTSDSQSQVEIADVGCGFGGLLVRLSTAYPDKLIIGLEIRDKVSHALGHALFAFRRQLMTRTSWLPGDQFCDRANQGAQKGACGPIWQYFCAAH